MEGVRKVPWTNHDSGLTRNCRSCDVLEGIHKYPLLHGSRYIYILMHISCPSKTLRMHANLMWSIVRIGMEGTRKLNQVQLAYSSIFHYLIYLLLLSHHMTTSALHSCVISSQIKHDIYIGDY